MLMIECPRCGFAQPKDQYCASCGVNMDALLSKPKPLWVRVLQNPNLHLSLIFLLMVLVVGWIFYTQSGLVKREVRDLLGKPISSREAGDPEEVREAAPVEAAPAAPEPEAAPAAPAAEAPADAPPPQPTVKPPQKIEMSFWEIPRETLAPILATAQRAGESTGGRAYYWPEGAKLLDALQSGGAPLTNARDMKIAADAQVAVETPPTAPEMFQFALAVQIVKPELKELAVRWVANLILPQPENPAETQPAVRQVIESNMQGNSVLSAQGGVLLLLVEPAHRLPKADYVTRAGEGPWSVFTSPEYRSGLTEWVIVITPK